MRRTFLLGVMLLCLFASAMAQENLTGVRVVRAFGREEAEAVRKEIAEQIADMFRRQESDGEWEKVPYYAYTNEKSKILLGHAETSIFMLQKFLLLTLEEVTSIRWHMGAYDTSVKGGDREYSAALQKCPIAMLTHIADDMSATLDEVQ